ncbi:hypothetical protein BH24GEM2_BH24GEM2_17150 [soil metagenome]|jgi:hypothetical protein
MRTRFVIPVILGTLGAACIRGQSPQGTEAPPAAPSVPPAVPRQSEPAKSGSALSGRGVRTLEGLTFEGETRVVEGRPKRLRTAVTVTNMGNRPVRIEYGPCSFHLRAYRHVHRTGRPVWDEQRWPNPNPKTGVFRICDLYAVTFVVEPGASHTAHSFQIEPTVPDVLGDSLPPGRYFFTARLELTVPLSKNPEVPTGSVVLTR